MRAAAMLVACFLMAIAGSRPATAETQPFRAGITRVTAPDATPFDVLVVYPTEAAEAAIKEGPFSLSASRDAPVASGPHFPIVLFSHGGGRRGGTPLLHRDLLLHLARSGFIVVAPFHPGGPQPFVNRPRHIRKALDLVLADPRFAARADPARIGMAGFSFGGLVTLLAAGAKLDLALLSAYCRDRSDDPRACDGVATDGSWANIPSRKSADALGLKALVLMEPFGAPFARDGLAALDLPVLIYRASQSDLRPEGNALALAAALPRKPHDEAVSGSHFVFADPCPPALKAEASEICSDPPGVDRAAILDRVRQQVATFLRDNL
jgi:predicted dienelactone hydrolase